MQKQRRHQSVHETLKLLFVLSGPIYLYAFELQYVPYGQWMLHLVTMLFVFGRLILVNSHSARLAPERI
jgi:hypothetical protein